MKTASAAPMVLLLSAFVSADESDPGFGRKDAAALYDSNCSGCHTAPDLSRKTDLVWLDQVRRTS